jgi:beta-glucanase (GH16 family)
MKQFLKFFCPIFFSLVLTNCQESDLGFGDITSPTNLEVDVVVQGQDDANPNGDGSGLVTFTASADNAISYKYVFSDGSEKNQPSGIFQKRFTKPGLNTYTVTVMASGRGGVTTNTTVEVTVMFNFTDDEAVDFLTDGTSKTWYWSASELGFLSVGLNSTDNSTNFYPNFYQTPAWEPVRDCLFDDELIFTKTGSSLTYELRNNGESLINREFLSIVGQANSHQYVDDCYSYSAPDVTGVKNVTLTPSESLANPAEKRGTVMTFSDGGFMGFYVGQSSYEIMSITPSRMVVRTVQEAFTPSGEPLSTAWYHIFTTIKPVQDNTDYTNLRFADEFNTDGAPDPTKWSYDLGAGGWGNDEAQTYTNNAANSIVSNGTLKITAKRNGSSNYTSARLKSENKFDFTYGKVECRAKLPVGAGTWPAIWLLGKNYATNTWPACGEIDIMEHRGYDPNRIHGSLHYPGRFGGNANTNTTLINNAASQFHDYKVIWTPSSIRFFVDNVLFHSFANSGSVPFNSDFFLILNVAMGGTFGGSIDPNFSEAAMEIDYIRVYQQ